MNSLSRVLLCLAAGLLLAFSLAASAEDNPATRPAKTSSKKTDVADSPYPKPISQLMIWNGEDFKGGGSWVTKGNSFHSTGEVSHSGKNCLEFHGEGANFIGGGFNFFGWYPPDSGVDITNYDNLSMWVRIDSPPQMGPGTLSISLNCSGTHKQSGSVPLANYCKEIDDGKWHEIVIPLKHLLTHDFDPSTTWELDISTWQPDARRFSVYFDDIAVDIRPQS